MIQIDIPMPKNCLECRFSWAGDSCTYCIAQCYHKPEGGFHLHKIKPTYKDREEQEVWREPSCPLIDLGPRVMTLDLQPAEWEDKVIWLEIKGKKPIPCLFRKCCDRMMFGRYERIMSFDAIGSSKEGGYFLRNYGVNWRCWTSRPTDEQRRAEPWK